jgi:hypothetical protein
MSAPQTSSNAIFDSLCQKLKKSNSAENLKACRSRRKGEAVIFTDSDFSMNEKDPAPDHKTADSISEQAREILRGALSQHYLIASHGSVRINAENPSRAVFG